MPLDYNAPILPDMGILRTEETPITHFLDMEDAKRITVLDAPSLSRDKEERIKEWQAAISFARTCHNTRPDEYPVTSGPPLGDPWEEFTGAVNGSLLWQVGEVLHYTLRMDGLSRVIAHQLVRARIGWTFSEACTGDQDWRHAAFLIPRNWGGEFVADAKIQLDRHKRRSLLDAKQRYADAIDAGEPPNTARLYLPPCLATFVHARVSLLALAAWYSKRSCTMTNSWEMVVLAERVKAAVLKATPWAAGAFVSPCTQGRCWYMGAYKNPTVKATYYRPDKNHDRFPWHPDSFPYREPHLMYSRPEAIMSETYLGRAECRPSIDTQTRVDHSQPWIPRVIGVA